jgi:hypothetical protein
VGLTLKKWDLRLMAGMALVAGAGLASGCMSSPTYGTDKTASAQLVTDLSGMFNFQPKKKAPIDYEPRPELVKPVKGSETLPPPQESVASAANPNWPESPEQRLARVRADADANADNPFYKSPVVSDGAVSTKVGSIDAGNGHAVDSGIGNPSLRAAQDAEFKAKLKESRQGDSTSRKYLSEPPLVYREAAADAPVGEAGEDEARKERRLKREARKKSGFTWADLNPF